MALIRNYDLIGGITINNCYFVITGLTAKKRLLNPDGSLSQLWDCGLTVEIFKDKATRESGGAAIDAVGSFDTSKFDTRFVYDPAGPLPIVQGYIYLMGQSYFAGAASDASS